ncbi:MAG TPA: hypothetical protein GXX28_07225 [Firmicutes bacterium]|nr:hypothetical protein [Bacillota bacterium]
MDKVWPKCFYKYLTVDLGHRSGDFDVSLSLNWLDYVDIMTAYRIAFPYHLKATWQASAQDRLDLSALTVNPASNLIKPANLLEVRYVRSFPLASAAGLRVEAFGMARAFPSEGWTLSVSPGAAVHKDFGKADAFVALNALDAKDYAVLSRDSNVVSLGATWSMYGDSRFNATLNTLLGPADPPSPYSAKTWLDLRFLFGSLYRK